MRTMTYKDATLEALAEEMGRDPTVFVMAEDLLGRGGGQGHYLGLRELLNGDTSRMLDTPISETAIVSSAVGAALAGMRPVIDMRFSNCLPACMDELVNQAAKSRYMFGGQGKVHMVVRCPDGIVKAQGAHHTDCLEAWFSHVPGLQVVVPSSPAEGKGLLKTAIRNENPVIFLEHKTLFKTEGLVPEESYTIPFGKARIARKGSDVTLVVYGVMVGRALEAAKILETEGIDTEVLDLRTLSPWDKETVLASARKTGRVVVAHEAVRQGGFGAELSATISEEAFSSLRTPVVRIGGPFVPIPATPPLEDLCRVLPANIVEAVHKVMV
ncbi:alpha-ketoacid dehydrogenase subunit beta [Oscillibacter valericigenes]|uniref:alpha-ketoacid dehydrogenase subunit beta n=1 Tax=Oscillibacter valericigenes TaxID=351091 RepID=UPI001959FEB7|nr:alpha-ketoacid dehydrogenase subunit beta [Oscillibacter valericigenes]MBM6910815.1 alpha-ketoacid dehydrogenase subunit beta [Oscillibacter valericigenes]